MDVKAGTVVMVLPGAVNRDPRRFSDPHEFQIRRANVREHIAFGRGVHSCPGAPLARVEGRVSLERMLDRMGEITVDEEFHGPEGARRFNYEPTYILRGLTDIHVRFTGLAARYASPRTQIDSPFCGAQLRNKPSGACATYDSLPLQLLLNSLTPTIGGDRK